MAEGEVESVEIDGKLAVRSKYKEGVKITRTTFPGVLSPAIIELNALINNLGESVQVKVPHWQKQTVTNEEKGVYGAYIIDEFISGEGEYFLVPGEQLEYAIVRTAWKLNDAPYFGNPGVEMVARNEFIRLCENNLVLETPGSILNSLFRFSKIRASESVFSTRGSLMHGPGGYNKYLAAIWANDQAEYVNPFFPFLGDVAGNESALNSFLHFARYINDDYKPIQRISIIKEIWSCEAGFAYL